MLVLATGLGAGLFYTFSCAVMPGLRLANEAVGLILFGAALVTTIAAT